MALLVNVFLAMFALQLAPTVICKVEQFKFGDLIAIDYYSEGKTPKKPVLVYIHWAVYVGTGEVKGLEGKVKSPDEDIFHIYGGDRFEKPLCVFDILSKLGGKPVVLNYLDKTENGKQNLKPLENKLMIEEMLKLHKKCVWWDPVLNDCEHVLAYVRYGKQIKECKEKKA